MFTRSSPLRAWYGFAAGLVSFVVLTGCGISGALPPGSTERASAAASSSSRGGEASIKASATPSEALVPVSISMSRTYTCALMQDSTVWCWGTMSTVPSDQDRDVVPAPLGETALQVSAGGDGHACLVTLDRTAKCWGSNSVGNLGDGTLQDRQKPVTVVGLKDVRSIHAFVGATCAILMTGLVKCWGSSRSGHGLGYDTPTPIQVPNLTDVVDMAGGQGQACAIRSDGTLWCWGDNYFGQLDDGTNAARLTPVKTKDLAGVTQIVAGWSHFCAILQNRSARCWGSGRLGTTGYGGTDDQPTPIAPKGLPGTIISVAAGDEHTCELAADGSVWCHGRNDEGQTGSQKSGNADILAPRRVLGMPAMKYIASGGWHNCGLSSDNVMWCWGENYFGQLGTGKKSEWSLPVKIDLQARR